jgi:hypothetical protein
LQSKFTANVIVPEKPPSILVLSSVHDPTGAGVGEDVGANVSAAVQSARRADPVAWLSWPAGHSRQEVEAGAGWYLEAGQEVQTPAAR